MRVLVTGSTGFIGRRVVALLAAEGHSVRAMTRSPSRASALFEGIDVEAVRGDALASESLARVCEGMDAVVHTIAAVREVDGFTFPRINAGVTGLMVDAAEAAGVSRFVYASAIGASSDPATPYLYSRWVAEQRVEISAIDSGILRFSVGFGKGDEFFNALAALVKLSPIVPIAGDGRARFQPISADDAARCLAAAVEEKGSRTFELGGPDHYTYDEMIDIIAETLGVRIAKAHVPLGLFTPVAAMMEALMPRPPVTPDLLKLLATDNTAELDSVQVNFGFMPMPLMGNLEYIKSITLGDALKINLGVMPARIRDH